MCGKRILLSLAVLAVFHPGRVDSQGAADKVTLQPVKYDGLQDAVLKNRGKVVLVDFWFVGCPPCYKAFPHMVELHQKHAKDGLAVITVHLDTGADPKTPAEAALKFLQKQGATNINLFLEEPPAVWQNKLRFSGAPCVFVFDRQGRWTQFKSEDDAIDYGKLDALVFESLKAK